MVWGSDFELVVSPRPHAALLSIRGGVPLSPAHSAQRTVTSCSPGSVWLCNMGLEKEKSDTSIIMDEDEFNRSIEPILSKKGKVYAAAPDRDPHDINAHLKVKKSPNTVRNHSLKVKPHEVAVVNVNYLHAPRSVTFLFSCNELWHRSSAAWIPGSRCLRVNPSRPKTFPPALITFSLCAVDLCDLTGRFWRCHRGAHLHAQLRQGVDRKQRRVWAGQIHLLPPADHAARRAPGFHPRGGVRGAQLHPHLVGRSSSQPAGVCLVLFLIWHSAKCVPKQDIFINIIVCQKIALKHYIGCHEILHNLQNIG